MRCKRRFRKSQWLSRRGAFPNRNAGDKPEAQEELASRNGVHLRRIFLADVIERQISRAVSTVLHAQKCAATDAAGVEHCGYGDLY
jgi:hypothetical protein